MRPLFALIITALPVLAEIPSPTIIRIDAYSTITETRRASTSYYSLPERRQRAVNVHIFNRATKTCNKAAIDYKTVRSVPREVPQRLRPYFDFQQNPQGFSDEYPNLWSLPESPQLIGFNERIVGAMGTPPKPIYETDFKFACHGNWFNTNPGRDN